MLRVHRPEVVDEALVEVVGELAGVEHAVPGPRVGLAEDWVTAPNRIGLFSSDADVLSDTAEPHRAGGYLSWHRRRGVS